MSKFKETDNAEPVSSFIQKLNPELGSLVDKIRHLVLESDSRIGQHIKWNSPAFFYKGEMKSFNAKEYKRDLLVINVNKGYALMVFPTGASIPGSGGILEGNYTDGRRMVTIRNAGELEAKKDALQTVIRKWTELAGA
ncbi:MAG: DUF1801 domain-containing protein [Chitinophagaceae bacterium]|nr:MAG: DUF1801 domain-containing protein [Chitinophagaceae bacterium]